MKHLPTAILGGVMVLIALASCARPPLDIAFVGPLTGPSSAVGMGGRDGFLLALSPTAATRKGPSLRLLVRDDRDDPDTCLAVLQSLKAEGCSLVLLGTTSQAAEKAVPWAMKHDMLVISPTISDPTYSGKKDLFIRVNASSSDYGLTLAQTVLGRYGKKRAAFVGDAGNDLYTKAVFDAFASEYRKLGGRLSFSMFFDSKQGVPGENMIASLKSHASDGIVIVAASTEVVLIAKDIERAGLHTRIFLPPWPLTPDLLQNGGDAVNGAVAVSIADLEYQNPKGRAFASRFREKYGEGPSFTAMFGYEASSILRQTIQLSRVYDAVSVRDKLLAIRKFEGLQGEIVFDDKGDASRSLFLYEIDHGAFKRVD
jgi:branched-chain amino acid transport system substrate-binding protein